MHIMEGYLPMLWCIFWYILCIPFVAIGVLQIKKVFDEHPDQKIILAVAGAFVFILSSLKMPSVTGSSSHPTGTGLGTILFGPCIVADLSVIVLIFQALLLAHGGIRRSARTISRWASSARSPATSSLKACGRSRYP